MVNYHLLAHIRYHNNARKSTKEPPSDSTTDHLAISLDIIFRTREQFQFVCQVQPISNGNQHHSKLLRFFPSPSNRERHGINSQFATINMLYAKSLMASRTSVWQRHIFNLQFWQVHKCKQACIYLKTICKLRL